MSNTSVVSFARPSYLAAVPMDETTKALMGSGSAGVKRISIEGGAFKLLDGKEVLATRDERWMNVIIVAASPFVNRQFYAEKYVPGKAALPGCYSVDGVKPATNSKTPQCNTCANCPQNVKGSGENGGRACRYSQRVAVVLEGDESNTVYQMTLPATAIFGEAKEGKMGLQVYARFLALKQTPITAVVTEVRFDLAGGKGVAELKFKAVRPLEEDEYYAAVEAGQSDDATKAITLDINYPAEDEDAPVEEAEAPAPVAKPVVRKAAPKPAPVVEEAAEEEVEEEVVEAAPVKVAAKPVAKPATAAPMSSIIAGWKK